ncbi:hypothetical protein PR001_g21263 [Phytophthora rubi]|uniref:Uncharacterized protein n=1 Tax=Phytophthora rubi TaxID=129364 RepID=A0A6A3J7V0_9STRA|nr:hypothetical protein PR001_g21263 [Phytophthora rubi]
MSGASIVPANSQRSRATAVKSFEDFLVKEVTLTEVHDRISKESTDPNDPFTCVLHVLAVALALQPAPGTRIFPQFAVVPVLSASEDQDEDDEQGLIAQQDRDLEEVPTCKTPQPRRANSAPGDQAYINRLLGMVSGLPAAKESGLTKGLISHPFRRGGAMHANVDIRISSNWVVVCGG